MIKVNVLEAKNRLSELLRAVQRGEEVVIANRGEPVARLVPAAGAAAQDEPPVGSAAAILKWLDENPLPESLRRTAEEIDANIATEREAWD
jgi:prevent-host-death family protein